MLLEDRVITTDQLVEFNDGTTGWLQLGPGVLDRLEPLGLHVLVPSGHLRIADDDTVMSCMAELQTGTLEPLTVRVLMPHATFMELPSAFEVLSRIPAAVSAVVTDWITDDCDDDAAA